MDVNQRISNLLSRINILDRSAFKKVILEVADQEHQELEDQILLISLYQKLLDTYALTSEETSHLLDIINKIPDLEEREKWTDSYFSWLVPEIKNIDFLSKYYHNLERQAKSGRNPEHVLADLNNATNIEFLNSQSLFYQSLKIIENLSLSQEDKLNLIISQYIARLNSKHDQIDKTYQEYSSLISASFPSKYESFMLEASRVYERTREEQTEIEAFIYKQKEQNSKSFWISYLNYFSSIPKSKRVVSELLSVFENAIGKSNDVEIWNLFLTTYDEYNEKTDNNVQILGYIKRYQRSHPYSSFPYIELLHGIPSRFPSMLFHENFLKVKFLLDNYQDDIKLDQWKDLVISYLRIYSSIMKTKHDYQILGDFFQLALNRNDVPFHSVERFIVGILEQLGELDEARKYLRQITSAFGNEAEGWLISYYFEKRNGDINSAFKVLTAAVNRSENLDWPERIFEEYLRIGELINESYKSLKMKVLKKKRHLLEMRQELVEDVVEVEENPNKRKHELDFEEDVTKKRSSNTRNREQLTVCVSGIPHETPLNQILKVFKDCGEIVESKLIVSNGIPEAHIEFTEEGSILRALAKDFKLISGEPIRVHRLTKTTIWVTNFPPTFTKIDIEKTFSAVGDIVSVRLPSLKFNSQRRFCYIEYSNSEDALAATNKFNGKSINGYELTVKISDPNSKQIRSGATEEGRELFVRNFDVYKVSSWIVKQLFEKYGNVENVHLPLSAKNKGQGKKNDGYGFVVFSTPDEAQAALSLNLVAVEGRAIEVSISKKKSEKEKRKEKFALSDYSGSENVLALKNLPETFNSFQLKEYFNQFGEVRNVVLEKNTNGALVVFETPREAGDAALKAEGSKIGEYEVQLATVSELKKLQNQSRNESPVPSGTPSSTPTTSFIPSSLRRKPKVSSISGTQVRSIQSEQSLNDNVKKTNEDFRAMLLGKK